MNWLVYVRMFMGVGIGLLCYNVGRSTPMEEKLETEIDLREPRSFVEGRHNILSVRVDGFHSLTVGFPDHTETHSVGNWEVFAMR